MSEGPMAESEAKKEAPKKEEAAAPQKKEETPKAGGGKGLMRTPIVVGVVMLLEAVVLFAGFKFLGSTPKVVVGAQFTATETAEKEAAPAEGGGEAEGGHGGGHAEKGASAPKGKFAEVPIIEFKAPNKRSGRAFLYDIAIVGVAKSDAAEKVKEALKQNEARVADRIRTIIAEGDPEKLGGGAEPGLETLRRQVKYQLDEIVGEGLIEEILVKKCIPFRADY